MKNKLLFSLINLLVLLAIPRINYCQAPNFGSANSFVLFSSIGAVSNTGLTHLTGNVGSNVGSSTGFGNVDGVMHDQDPASALCTADLLIGYNDLNAATPTFFPGVLLGNGVTLNAGIYSIPAAATLNLELILDGQGDPNALFIIQINGSFATTSNSKVKLVNGAQACNVFWKVEGLVNMAAGTSMKGTVVAHNAAIVMNVNDTLEGRALAINGAVTVDGILAYTPLGCGTPILTGPLLPSLLSTECFVLFSGIGPVTNTGITHVSGDVGSNSGITSGFNPLFVAGTIHPVPDGTTSQCSSDFTTVYNNLGALVYDIELLYPALFGHNLVLTPHIYLMNGAVTFTDTLFLNAENNPDAVFVFQVNGAFSTSTYSKVVLLNGAQAKNVFWRINGAISINDYSIFNGTIIAQGAIDLMTGVQLNGRALTGVGAINTVAINAFMPTSCAPFTVTEPINQTACVGDSVSFEVVATGLNLTYQWQLNGVDLVDGGNISGTNTSILTIDPVTLLDAAINYTVIMMGSFVPTDTSNQVSLTVDAAPLITFEPEHDTICLSDNASFTVVASGAGLNYQWRSGQTNLVNGGTISGVNTATLTITGATLADALMDYNVLVSGACPTNDTSVFVSLIIHQAPLITSEPIYDTICLSDNASFTVVASGSGLNYQWRSGQTNLVNGGTISGVNTATLTITGATLADALTNYNVLVSGACPSNDTSVFVSLTIEQGALITQEPVLQVKCVDSTAVFSVQASGSNLTYQWRKGTVNLINGGTITGANTATLTLSNLTLLDAALDYNVIVSGACSSADTSVDVSLTVNNCGLDLSLVKTASNMQPTLGNTIVFTIVIENPSQDSATSVVVAELLESGYTYVSSSSSQGNYDPTNGVWTVGTLPAGTSSVLTITVIVMQTGSYANTATVTAFEAETDSTNNTMTIQPVPNNFQIPEGFSPNDDFINDLFEIEGILEYRFNSIVIFNRWGNKVFDAAPYVNTWDGTSQSSMNLPGDALPVGTYFYVLDLGDGSDIIKGTVYLNR